MNIDMYNMDTMQKITLGKLRMMADEDKPEGTNVVLVKMSATFALQMEENEEIFYPYYPPVKVRPLREPPHGSENRL